MKFDYYNEHPDASSEAIENLKSEIVKMKNDVDEANQELLERNNNINSLQNKSESLKESISRYKSGAIKINKMSGKKKNLYLYWYNSCSSYYYLCNYMYGLWLGSKMQIN